MLELCYNLWSTLCTFAGQIHIFIMQPMSDLVEDVLRKFGIWDLFVFGHGGPEKAWAQLASFFGELSVLEYCLTAGLVFILGYKLLSWITDILP